MFRNADRLLAVVLLGRSSARAPRRLQTQSGTSPPGPPPGPPLPASRSKHALRNATGQQPAFAGQTRGCGVQSNVAFTVTVVATGLSHPWAVEPLPNGDLLVTERPGRMRVVSAAGALGTPLTGLPPVDARGQGGLLDVALSPTFATDRTIFWTFRHRQGNATSVARGCSRRTTERRTSARDLPCAPDL